ncbi:hypothetical protein GCM10009624_14200 [Gordonia sinesedis]
MDVLAEGSERAGAEGAEITDAGLACWRRMANLKWDGWTQGAAARAADTVTGSLNGAADELGSLGAQILIGVAKTAGGQALVREHRVVTGLVRVIESGDLYVADDWSVLVRSTVREPKTARLLALAANGFQDQLNPRVVALSKADDRLSQLLRGQTQNVLGINLSDMPADPRTPRDVTDVLYSERGREDQRNKLSAHMLGTVVDRTSTTRDGTTVTTLTMLDGGKQVYTNRHQGGVGDTMELYGYAGNRVATRVNQPDGSVVTTLYRQGKSDVVVRESRDGSATAEVDGVTFPIPGTKDVAQAVAGGGMAALEPYVAQGFPYLTASQAEKLTTGTKLAGPALSILGTAVAVTTAENAYDRCVAGVAGGVGLAADVTMMLVAPEASGPFKAGARAIGMGLGAGAVGNLIGQLVCRP